MSAFIEDLSEKTVLNDNDLMIIADSQASYQNKKVKKTSLWTYIINKLFLYTTTKSSDWVNSKWYDLCSIPSGVPVYFEFELVSNYQTVTGVVSCASDNSYPLINILSINRTSMYSAYLYSFRLVTSSSGSRLLQVVAGIANSGLTAYIKFKAQERNNLTVLNWTTTIPSSILVSLNFNLSSYSGIMSSGKIFANGSEVATLGHGHSELWLEYGAWVVYDTNMSCELLMLVDDESGNAFQSIIRSNLSFGYDTNTCNQGKSRSIIWLGENNANHGIKCIIIGDTNISDSLTSKCEIIGNGNNVTQCERIIIIGIDNGMITSENCSITGLQNELSNSTQSSIIGSKNTLGSLRNSLVIGENHAFEGLRNVLVSGKCAIPTMNTSRAYNNNNSNYNTNCQKLQMSFVAEESFDGNNAKNIFIAPPDSSTGDRYFDMIDAYEVFRIDIQGVIMLTRPGINDLIESVSFHCSGIIDLMSNEYKFTDIDQISSLASVSVVDPQWCKLSCANFIGKHFQLFLEFFNLNSYSSLVFGDTATSLDTMKLTGNFTIDLIELPGKQNVRDYFIK